ncbi:MAG TPA: DUF92 domain-containing protein [Candidatus Poseidoniaceae archaeon]|jgi:uncharacterized protein (TIGR00297 family)|nr:MAG TPA: DUF92 domain-containing protein [Candidatus Poseidoniales archaeon]HII11488.1 DUF92 domain-containing protein [Candidatus Poseidoniaceae archaeon]|tara:strand:- start:139 stop:903 length:765 start_codon:yes stop_codon:yes gene_type:complete
MDVLTGGLNQGNLAVTAAIILGLVIVSSRAKMLDRAGVIAAAILGLSVGGLGHWTWLLILLGFLLSAHKATKWRFEEKLGRGMSESEDGHRSYGNVIANGGLPGLVAVYAYLTNDWETGLWMFSAAVAVAASDTFASEIGCLDDNVRMITTFKKCEAGLNGGFSPSGQKAALAGAALIGILSFPAWYLTTDYTDIQTGLTLSLAVIVVGWLGCQMDSLLGALLENRGFLTKGGVNGISITFGFMLMSFFIEYLL